MEDIMLKKRIYVKKKPPVNGINYRGLEVIKICVI